MQPTPRCVSNNLMHTSIPKNKENIPKNEEKKFFKFTNLDFEMYKLYCLKLNLENRIFNLRIYYNFKKSCDFKYILEEIN